MDALLQGQHTAYDILDELRQRPVGLQSAEIHERLRIIEELLNRLMQTRHIDEERITDRRSVREVDRVRERTEESVSETSTDIESLRRRWSDLLRRPEHIRIAAPVPRPPGPSLDEQLLELLGVPPVRTPITPQPPPPLVPFTYQPPARPSRSRSSSPDRERSYTAPPLPEPSIFSPETFHPPLRRRHPRQPYRRPRREPTEPPGEGEGEAPPVPAGEELPIRTPQVPAHERTPRVPAALPILVCVVTQDRPS